MGSQRTLLQLTTLKRKQISRKIVVSSMTFLMSKNLHLITKMHMQNLRMPKLFKIIKMSIKRNSQEMNYIKVSMTQLSCTISQVTGLTSRR